MAKTTTVVLLIIIAAAAFVSAEVVIDKIGGACGGKGDQAPPHLAMDNCWPGYTCNHAR